MEKESNYMLLICYQLVDYLYIINFYLDFYLEFLTINNTQ